jgi:hypothetical protein
LELPSGVEVEDDLELPVVTVVDLKRSAAEEEAKEAAAADVVSQETSTDTNKSE